MARSVRPDQRFIRQLHTLSPERRRAVSRAIAEFQRQAADDKLPALDDEKVVLPPATVRYQRTLPAVGLSIIYSLGETTVWLRTLRIDW